MPAARVELPDSFDRLLALIVPTKVVASLIDFKCPFSRMSDRFEFRTKIRRDGHLFDADSARVSSDNSRLRTGGATRKV